jgi:hypothetical protein
MNILDYSLLLGEITTNVNEVREACAQNPELGRGVYIDENGKPYILGVIDPLNVYDFRKVVEYQAKNLKYAGT